jgi:hypothetical protein
VHASRLYGNAADGEGQLDKGQRMEWELCTVMWETRSQVADMLAKNAQVLLMMQHTPEALSTHLLLHSTSESCGLGPTE